MLVSVECNHKFYTIINCLLLHARFLIFRCKIAKNIPNLSKYFLVVQNAKTVERLIAQKYNRLDAYRKKWSIYCNVMLIAWNYRIIIYSVFFLFAKKIYICG